MRLVIVTGMSGAGKATALKILEDAGYFCVDNLPVPFVDKFAELTASGNSEITKVAIGLDIRSGRALSQMEPILEHMAARGISYEILFLDAGNEILGERDIVQIAKSTVFNCKADALCVSGLTAGVETDQQILKEVKDAVKDTVVLANTGCRIDNMEKQLAVADGAVVGTTFKYDGVFENGVDKERVLRFMDKVHSCRKS